MSVLYPEIEPYEHGMLDVGDGNLVYWEQCGNPEGNPIVLLHGGPGSGWSEGIRRTFDPRAYRIILFDQRNCGRSTPDAGNPEIDLSANTTEHLLADMERLRRHLRVDKWMVFGGSWGSTLALAYAERHAELVTGIILVAVTTTRKSEIDWLYYGVARIFPAEWDRFRQGACRRRSSRPRMPSPNQAERLSRALKNPITALARLFQHPARPFRARAPAVRTSPRATFSRAASYR